MNVSNANATQDTAAWIFFVWCQFAVALGLTTIGIFYLPTDWWFKGYIFMGVFFSTAAAFTLSKTIRDNHEAQRQISRVVEAKAEKLLSEYELRKS